ARKVTAIAVGPRPDRAGQVGGLDRADLLLDAAFQQIYELVAGDLIGEPGAPLAQHAPLTVEQYLRRDRDGLGERALDHASPHGRWTAPGSAAGTRRPCHKWDSPAGG